MDGIDPGIQSSRYGLESILGFAGPAVPIPPVSPPVVIVDWTDVSRWLLLGLIVAERAGVNFDLILRFAPLGLGAAGVYAELNLFTFPGGQQFALPIMASSAGEIQILGQPTVPPPIGTALARAAITGKRIGR